MVQVYILLVKIFSNEIKNAVCLKSYLSLNA